MYTIITNPKLVNIGPTYGDYYMFCLEMWLRIKNQWPRKYTALLAKSMEVPPQCLCLYYSILSTTVHILVCKLGQRKRKDLFLKVLKTTNTHRHTHCLRQIVASYFKVPCKANKQLLTFSHLECFLLENVLSSLCRTQQPTEEPGVWPNNQFETERLQAMILASANGQFPWQKTQELFDPADFVPVRKQRTVTEFKASVVLCSL